MTAYDPTEWHDLFVAVAGASAALAGLVFVAVSINLERILQFEGLPELALETILLLVGVLIVAIVGLIPGQSHAALGAELLVVSLAIGATLVRLPAERETPEPVTQRDIWGRMVVRMMGIVLLGIGSLSVLVAAGGGLYWVVAGIVFAIVGAVVNAWVLLVEILR